MRFFFRRLKERDWLYVKYVMREKSFPIVNFWRPHLLELGVSIVEHCNLNCKGCCTLSPLTKSGFCDVAQTEKDLSELSKKMRLASVRFIGGEPLLHPNIAELLWVAKKACPKSRIAITTNGSLLQRMSDDFWEACRRNKAVLTLSVYPPFRENLFEYLELARSKGVCIVHLDVISNWDSMRRSFREGGGDVNIIYRMCRYKKCYQLWHSKLYLCVGCFFQHYNRYFNKNYPTIKGYDIYKYSGKELVQFMKRPDPACRYCTWVMKKETSQWGYSKREKSEWCEDV